MRRPIAVLVLLLVGIPGCGGDDGAGTVNTEDSDAVSAAFRTIKRDTGTLEAAEALGEITTEFEDATGSGSTDVDTGAGEAAASLDDQVQTIIDALSDESPETTIPTEADQTVAAFLSEVANQVAKVDEDLAEELDRTREALSDDAEGGPSAGAPTDEETGAETTTTEAPPGEASPLADVEQRLKQAGYSVNKESSTGTEAAVVVDGQFHVALYPAEAEAEKNANSISKTVAGGKGEVETVGPVLVWYTGGGSGKPITPDEQAAFDEIVAATEG